MDFSTRFTALGLSGSGKTCYVMGMYSEMASGIRGWTIRTANADADRISRQLRIMENRTGGDRFPSGTQDYEFDDYEFELYFRNQKIMNFNWVDYVGGILENSSLNYDSLSLLEDCILLSTTLYIFIDGEMLCTDDINKKIKNVRMNCSNYINPRITNFIKNHEDMMPPVVFVITKADLCSRFNNLDEIKKVLRECFSSVFNSEETPIYIVQVSLGEDIAEDDYSGEIEPVNIQTPFFIGIAHDFLNKCAELLNEIKSDNERMNEAIDASKKQIIKDNMDIIQSQKTIEGNVAEIEKRKQDNSKKLSENDRYLREIEEAQRRSSEYKERIRDQERYIEEKSSGAWIFNFVKKAWNRSEIENARNNIRSYEKQKKEVNDQIELRECWKSDNNRAINDNNSEIERRNKDTEKQKQNIHYGYVDIEEQDKIIKKCEINIAENTKKRERYVELLSYVNDELRKQQIDEQFIAIKDGQTVDVDFSL